MSSLKSLHSLLVSAKPAGLRADFISRVPQSFLILPACSFITEGLSVLPAIPGLSRDILQVQGPPSHTFSALPAELKSV